MTNKGIHGRRQDYEDDYYDMYDEDRWSNENDVQEYDCEGDYK